MMPSATYDRGGGEAVNARDSQPSARCSLLREAVSQISIERKCDRLASG
jgi:hypothetical protein